MDHIDVVSVARGTIACEFYSNLITRPTGAAVRNEIERMLAERHERSLAILDFSHVTMIDYSCADEIVAKLLMRAATEPSPHDAYFVFRGLSDDHWESVEHVLHHHGLALAVETRDGLRLVGVLPDREREIWELLRVIGGADASTIADRLSAPPDEVRDALGSLWRKRLVMPLDTHFVVVGSSLSGGHGGHEQH